MEAEGVVVVKVINPHNKTEQTVIKHNNPTLLLVLLKHAVIKTKVTIANCQFSLNNRSTSSSSNDLNVL